MIAFSTRACSSTLILIGWVDGIFQSFSKLYTREFLVWRNKNQFVSGFPHQIVLWPAIQFAQRTWRYIKDKYAHIWNTLCVQIFMKNIKISCKFLKRHQMELQSHDNAEVLLILWYLKWENTSFRRRYFNLYLATPHCLTYTITAFYIRNRVP